MKLNKGFLLFFGIIFLLIILYILSLINSIKDKKTSTISPTPTLTIATPFPTYSFLKKINISGVDVNNILESPIETNQRGDILFYQIPSYQMVYFPQSQGFLIDIQKKPFLKVREEAEKDFIKKLGISKNEACRLKVNIVVSCYVDEDHCGINYPLSFCKNKE